MEEENLGFFHSPVMIKSTPMKRLGLSRKRKSCGYDGNSIVKIQACSGKSSTSVQSLAEKVKIEKKIDQEKPSLSNKEETWDISYNVELKDLRERISAKEEKLKAIKLDKYNITNLEELINLWKTGCKNAFLHLAQLLKEKHSEKMDNQMIMKNLGILNTMNENFENDNDIFSDFSQ